MPVLANTILGGLFPYIATLYLSPLVLVIEVTIVWKRHKPLGGLAKTLLAIFIANIASGFIGMALAKGAIRGVTWTSHTGQMAGLVVWAWAMSCATEYVVLRLMIRGVRSRPLVITTLLMNAVSYVPLCLFLWLVILR